MPSQAQPRKRRARQKTTDGKNYYINKETETAIDCYNKSKSQEEREKLFEEKIRRPFEKLIENIVHKYSFNTLGNPNSLKDNLMAKLVINLDKFMPEKGKAFSYFGAAVKNELLSMQKETMKFVSINQTEHFENSEFNEQVDVQNDVNKIMQETYEYEINQKELLTDFIASLKLMIQELSIQTRNKKEKEYYTAINKIINQYEDINISSSKHIYAMVKNLTILNLKDISMCTKKLKALYIRYKNYYFNSNDDINEKKFVQEYLNYQ